MAAFGISYYWLPLLFEGKRPPQQLVAAHFWIALSGTAILLAASLCGGLAGGAVANLGLGDWNAAIAPFNELTLAGESLLFTSAILFGVNLYGVIGCPLRACCPKVASTEEAAPEEGAPVEAELSEEDEADKKSMDLTFLTFVLATILVIAFAGVVFSLIL